jgi:hypothetical protein
MKYSYTTAGCHDGEKKPHDRALCGNADCLEPGFVGVGTNRKEACSWGDALTPKNIFLFQPPSTSTIPESFSSSCPKTIHHERIMYTEDTPQLLNAHNAAPQLVNSQI